MSQELLRLLKGSLFCLDSSVSEQSMELIYSVFIGPRHFQCFSIVALGIVKLLFLDSDQRKIIQTGGPIGTDIKLLCHTKSPEIVALRIIQLRPVPMDESYVNQPS